jgi:hypothetical protein
MATPSLEGAEPRTDLAVHYVINRIIQSPTKPVKHTFIVK